MANLLYPLVGVVAPHPSGWKCPRCHTHGAPLSITVAYGTQSIEFRCPNCNHKWTDTTVVEKTNFPIE
jgi:hypothetical protein